MVIVSTALFSVVFSRDTIDPKLNRNNKLYGADAWTPTMPTTYYKANQGVVDKVDSEIYKLVGKKAADALGYPDLTQRGVSERLDSNSGSIVDAYSNNRVLKGPSLALAYLHKALRKICSIISWLVDFLHIFSYNICRKD